MGDLVDVKRARIYRLLRWLATKNNIIVEDGGKHQYLVKHSSWKRPFPIPFRDSVVNKHIVRTLMNQLVDSGVCTEEEFRLRLK
jgi:hypothetical protein